MSNLVGYIRVSTEDGQEASVAMQRHRLEAYATMRGDKLVEVVVDEGVSGGTPFCDRPGGQRVLDLVKAKAVTGIASLKLDRLFRNAGDALTKVEQWEKQRVALHLVDMGGATIDTATASGKLFLTMLAGFAEFERATIRERTRNVLRHKRDTGRAYNHARLGYDHVEDGTTPKGKPAYRAEANEAEQALLARIKALHEAGGSYLGIASTLNAEGVTGKAGGRFYASTIKAILSR